jgi:probable phosphoglycerate mutase
MRLHFGRGIALFGALLFATSFVASGPETAAAGPKPTPVGYDVLFVRHAEANPPDGPLSERGLSQAAALADILHDEPVNAVYTSMLQRAFQTGAAVASDHDLPLVADAHINEVEFDLTGVPPASIPGVVLERLRQWLEGENRDEGFGGESFNDIQSRWNEWWAGFVAEHHTDRGTAVVVAHGALLILMIPEICHNALDPDFVLGHPLVNTAIIQARLHPNGVLSCTQWAGTPIPTAVAATNGNR